MALIFITGSPGTGKSTVEAALRQRGYQTHDVDDIGGAYSNATGQKVDFPPPEQRTPEWFEQHSWLMPREEVERLKSLSQDQLRLLCGTAANEAKMLDLFDQVLYLDVDEDTLRDRLASRTDNDYGKNEHELQAILGRHGWIKQAYRDHGATFVDATQSPDAVIQDIVVHLKPLQ